MQVEQPCDTANCVANANTANLPTNASFDGNEAGINYRTAVTNY